MVWKTLELTAERVGATIHGGGQGFPAWLVHNRLNVRRGLSARRWAA